MNRSICGNPVRGCQRFNKTNVTHTFPKHYQPAPASLHKISIEGRPQSALEHLDQEHLDRDPGRPGSDRHDEDTSCWAMHPYKMESNHCFPTNRHCVELSPLPTNGRDPGYPQHHNFPSDRRAIWQRASYKSETCALAHHLKVKGTTVPLPSIEGLLSKILLASTRTRANVYLPEKFCDHEH